MLDENRDGTGELILVTAVGVSEVHSSTISSLACCWIDQTRAGGVEVNGIHERFVEVVVSHHDIPFVAIFKQTSPLGTADIEFAGVGILQPFYTSDQICPAC